MLFLTDENFDNDILRGILRENPECDVIRVQDTEIYQADDREVLAWAAQENRILLTHDANTLIGFAYERLAAGLTSPGVIEVNKKQISIGQAIAEMLLIIGAGNPADFENQVTYLPLH
jgi:predicted nuclease of predicted toxin-antitoxin system